MIMNMHSWKNLLPLSPAADVSGVTLLGTLLSSSRRLVVSSSRRAFGSFPLGGRGPPAATGGDGSCCVKFEGRESSAERSRRERAEGIAEKEAPRTGEARRAGGAIRVGENIVNLQGAAGSHRRTTRARAARAARYPSAAWLAVAASAFTLR